MDLLSGAHNSQDSLTKIYTDTKTSYNFVQDAEKPVEDPDLAVLYRDLRMQKDRLVAWGLEWSDSSRSPDIDESISKAGLSDIVASIMGTIKKTLAEAEPLWESSKRISVRKNDLSEKSHKTLQTDLPIWNRDRFERLITDLTDSLDILEDLSRIRDAVMRDQPSMESGPAASDDYAGSASTHTTLQEIDPAVLIFPHSATTAFLFPEVNHLHSEDAKTPTNGEHNSRFIAYRRRTSILEYTHPLQALIPVLLEYVGFDAISNTKGKSFDLKRLEAIRDRLSVVHQQANYKFGVLKAIGYFEDVNNKRFGLVHELPQLNHTDDSKSWITITDLEHLVNHKTHQPALEVKFHMAYDIARVMFDLHEHKLVHGALDTSNICFVNATSLSYYSHSSQINLRRPFLTSSFFFSHTSYNSSLDVRDLGVLLLEIGTWQSLRNVFTDPLLQDVDLGQLYKQMSINCGRVYTDAAKACFELGKFNVVDEATEPVIKHLRETILSNLKRCCALDNYTETDTDDEDILVVTAEHFNDFQYSIDDEGVEASHLPETSTPAAFVHQSLAAIASLLSNRENNSKRKRPVGSSSEKSALIQEPRSSRLRLFHGRKYVLESFHYQHFTDVIGPALCKALKKFMKTHAESISMSLESMGETADNIRPTILIECMSVKEVRSILKRKFSYDATTYRLVIRKGSITRSKLPGSEATKFPQEAQRTTAYQQRPAGGASIGAYSEQQHLEAVSFGGLLMVDEKPLGLTVHHMLDDPDALEYASHRSMVPKHGYLTDLEDEVSSHFDSDAESDYSETRSTTSSPYDTEEEEEEEEDEYEPPPIEPGDIAGIDVGCGTGYFITQPAFSDVAEQTAPCDTEEPEATPDLRHLKRNKLGEVYASSGIRRRRLNHVIHEIDWALFSFESGRLPGSNQVQGASKYCSVTEYPTKHAAFRNLGDRDVHCNARTTGLQTGYVLPGLRYIKMYGRTSPSMSYEIAGPFGVGGDSGSWVYNNDDGSVCGHILAYSHRKQVAYICPMEVIMADIAETLGVEVRLPSLRGLANKEEFKKASSGEEPSRRQSPVSSISMPARRDMNIDAGRTSVCRMVGL